MHYLIDGFNFLHAVVLKGRDRATWWSTENQARVVKLVELFAGGEVAVIFDGSSDTVFEMETSVSVQFAPSADDRIVELTQLWVPLSRVVVVTADRALADRCRHLGAARQSPWQFRDLLSAP